MIQKKLYFPIYILLLVQLFALQSCEKEPKQPNLKENPITQRYLYLGENILKTKNMIVLFIITTNQNRFVM